MKRPSASFPFESALNMGRARKLPPGAVMSGLIVLPVYLEIPPWLLYSVTLSNSFMAATVITSSTEPQENTRLLPEPSFPAATTTVTPLLIRFLVAKSTEVTSVLKPKLMLATVM